MEIPHQPTTATSASLGDAHTAELGDDEVVARVRGGDVRSFEVLMRRYNRRVFRTVRAVLGSDDEAEDVMQHAYLRAFEHLEGYRGGARFSTWLTRIALYEAFARLRLRKRAGSLDDDTEAYAMADERQDPEQDVGAAELRVIASAAIDDLPTDFRLVFMLRAVEQMSVADVAESLSIPEDTVKTRYFRARERLRKSILERVDASTPAAFDFMGERCDRVVAAVLLRLAR